MFGLVVINSKGKVFSGEEQSAIRRASLAFLRTKSGDVKAYFSHPVCSGVLSREREGMYGTFAGTIFLVQADATDGIARSLTFLLPRASEHMLPDEHEESLVSMVESDEGLHIHFEPIRFEGTVDLHTLQ